WSATAPTPAPPQPPEAETAPDPVPQAEPSPEDAPEPEPAPEPAAPEEAAPEIVTEAEEAPAGAPETSLRPAARPERPASADPEPAEPETETAEAPDPEPAQGETETAEAADPDPDSAPQDSEADREATSQAIDDILAQVTDGGESAPAAGAPPLSLGERDALRVAVQDCWVVDVGSQAANVTVVLGMEMNRDGTVVDGSLEMVSAEGGSGRAVETAFQAARRAVLRCQQDGYDLPDEKYEHWQRIEMVFDPSGMRLR
ncbi:MAG: cell envelope biogenesis protein TolA, partial [Rhodosalinus sp.]